ncbi:MAG: hypothetical protein QNJ97_17535 [Myxococcota bacterium]|nr:hypothetical protein [Myxococcota bacterium]
MKKRFFLIFLTSTLMACSCGQDSIELPNLSGSDRECGKWYPPHGTDSETDTTAGSDPDVTDSDSEENSEYGLKAGKTFPCLVWESVRLGTEDKYVNIGEEYLKKQHGLSDKKAIVIVFVTERCPGCPTLIKELTEDIAKRDALNKLALIYGVAYIGSDVNELDWAVSKLTKYGWPVSMWPATNDAEQRVRLLEVSFPWIMVINLENMNVHTQATGTFEAGYHFKNVDELLRTIEAF